MTTKIIIRMSIIIKGEPHLQDVVVVIVTKRVPRGGVDVIVMPKFNMMERKKNLHDSDIEETMTRRVTKSVIMAMREVVILGDIEEDVAQRMARGSVMMTTTTRRVILDNSDQGAALETGRNATVMMKEVLHVDIEQAMVTRTVRSIVIVVTRKEAPLDVIVERKIAKRRKKEEHGRAFDIDIEVMTRRTKDKASKQMNRVLGSDGAALVFGIVIHDTRLYFEVKLAVAVLSLHLAFSARRIL
mmetsp:Transcript_9071/g.13219  ORF Transcript_9071/g.13219 Transcript_9071/m.13219 type:complete len:243 (+) Transcript_9071:393-1121(+)